MKYIDGVSSNEDSGNEEEEDQDQGAFSSLQTMNNVLSSKNVSSEGLHLNHDIADIVDAPGEEGEEKSESGEEIVDTFRVIGLRRKAGESLVSEITMTMINNLMKAIENAYLL